MADILICYSRPDEAPVWHLCQRLEEAGLNVLDVRYDVDTWRADASHAIRTSVVVVVFWCERRIESAREICMAVEAADKPLWVAYKAGAHDRDEPLLSKERIFVHEADAPDGLGLLADAVEATFVAMPAAARTLRVIDTNDGADRLNPVIDSACDEDWDASNWIDRALAVRRKAVSEAQQANVERTASAAAQRKATSRSEENAGVRFADGVKYARPSTSEEAPVGGWVKRAFDITVSLAAIVLLAPLLLLVAIAVKIESSGPAILKQDRSGFRGRTFRIYKFRTIALSDFHASAGVRDNYRITRLGMFLRRSSWDELPQLFNVLRGEMSIVGPRPHALVHDEQFESVDRRYSFRRLARPGITGLAQVSGGTGPTETPAKVRRRVSFDVEYVRTWSFSRDLLILARTAAVLGQTEIQCDLRAGRTDRGYLLTKGTVEDLADRGLTPQDAVGRKFVLVTNDSIGPHPKSRNTRCKGTIVEDAEFGSLVKVEPSRRFA